MSDKPRIIDDLSLLDQGLTYMVGLKGKDAIVVNINPEKANAYCVAMSTPEQARQMARLLNEGADKLEALRKGDKDAEQWLRNAVKTTGAPGA